MKPDLNLLVALDALLQESNVSRAAARLGLSTPAMSHALGRLRREHVAALIPNLPKVSPGSALWLRVRGA